MPRLIALVVTVLLAACAHHSRARLTLPEPRLAPAAMAMDVSLAQRLTFRAASNDTAATQRTLDAQLEIDASSLRLAGFAAGRRMLLLNWNGARLDEQRAHGLPASVRGASILRDIQFVYAPHAPLQAALPRDWQLLDTDTQRELTFRGRSAIVIDYATMPRWNGALTLDNRIEGYRLEIESVAAAVESN